MSGGWRIRLLGGLCVEAPERRIERFRTQKAAALLAFLAHHRDAAHPREVLVEMLWLEAEPSASRRNLRVTLTSLRHQLEPPGVPAGAILRADPFSVQTNPDNIEVDTWEFAAALRDAAQARDDAARTARAGDCA